MPRLVLVVPSYHCDIVWRRPPKEQAALRRHQYDAALDMLARSPEFCFEFDQALLVREYLHGSARRLRQLRQYVREGRVEITGGGESIPDNNLVSGEGLVRNLLLGRLWFEETLGAVPTVANYDDAFGQTAQLPQIMRGFGYESFRDTRTPGLDPAEAARGVLWEGLDGTRIFYLPAHAALTEYTHICNLPIVYEPEERLQASLAEALARDLPVVFCRYCSEEERVEEHVVALVQGCVTPPDVELRFGLCAEVMAAAQQANPLPQVVRGELNPTLQGTHASRISIKQAYRRAEWATRVAETVATAAALQGARYPADRFADLWRKLSYVQFHDSICGCHSDAVNRHVMGYCRSVTRHAEGLTGRSLRGLVRGEGPARAAHCFNPLPFRYDAPLALDLPEGHTLSGADGAPLPAQRHARKTLVIAPQAALGLASYELVKAQVPQPAARPGRSAAGQEFAVGPYRLTPTDAGATIRWRDRVITDGPFPEVRFRQEDGGLWMERYLGPVYPESMGERKLVRLEQGPVCTRFVWQGTITGQKSRDLPLPRWLQRPDSRPPVFSDLRRLTWEKELVVYERLERMDVIVRLDFAGQNTEVLLAFPLQLNLGDTRALYDVPFAAVERRPYFEVPSDSPEAQDAPLPLAALGGTGHYPALDWVAYGDGEWGLVLANQGTPAHRLMNGDIEVIVLRSPTLTESGLTPSPASRENGSHEFRFALEPYESDPFTGGAYRLGQMLNAPPAVTVGEASPPRPELLRLQAEGVVLSCLKPAERGEGFIVRTYETRGQAAQGALEAAFAVGAAHETDLMEQPQRDVDLGRLTWRPYEIKTLRLMPATERAI